MKKILIFAIVFLFISAVLLSLIKKNIENKKTVINDNIVGVSVSSLNSNEFIFTPNFENKNIGGHTSVSVSRLDNKIVFDWRKSITENEVWVMDINKEEAFKIHSSRLEGRMIEDYVQFVSRSPYDSQVIMLLRDSRRNSNIYLMDINGESVRAITDYKNITESNIIGQPFWINENEIVYLEHSYLDSGKTQHKSVFFVVDVVSGDLRKLIDINGSIRDFGLFDENKIQFTKELNYTSGRPFIPDNNLYIFDVINKKEKTFPSDKPIVGLTSLSPDKSKIAYFVNKNGKYQNTELIITDYFGKTVKIINDFDNILVPIKHPGIIWSADSEKVAFIPGEYSSNDEAVSYKTNSRKLYTANVLTSEVKKHIFDDFEPAYVYKWSENNEIFLGSGYREKPFMVYNFDGSRF